ncbi:MAG: zinc ribbon domain-containing protein [Candidatus Methylomirabilales bacterium]
MANEDSLRDTRGKLWGKPDRKTEGRYLLSGLVMCGLCRWTLTVLGGGRRMYGCSHHHRRGTCENDLLQQVEAVDAAFLGALEREKGALARKIERMVAAIRDGRAPSALVQEIAKAEARGRGIEAERTRLAAAPTVTALDLKRIER